MLKHTLSAAPETEASIGDELRDGHASTDAAQALTEAVNEQVQQQLAHREFFGEPKKHRKKLKPAIGAFLADLLSAEGNWVYRSLKTDGFTGAPVGARVFIRSKMQCESLALWSTVKELLNAGSVLTNTGRHWPRGVGPRVIVLPRSS